MKIYSYLDSGTVVLATAMRTHTQVLDHQTAFLVEANPAAMAEGLRLLSGDDRLRARLAAKAKEKVQQEFTFAAFQRKLNNFYSLVEEKIADQQRGRKN